MKLKLALASGTILVAFLALGVGPALSTDGDSGWVTNPANGHLYRLTDPLSWPDAERQAVEWGGHLATLNDAAEEAWVRDQFGTLEHFWIGFNDIETEGSFEWSSGEPVTYTNWCEGEPNNFNDEDAAIINWAHAPLRFGDCWNDLPVAAMLRGIVEVSGAVTIDIKPGSFPNSINPGSRGKIPVAILSDARFDAPTEVDRSSLTFGRTGDEQSLAVCSRSPEDVNGDGLLDLACHFTARYTGFQTGDTQGVLKGRTRSGTPITGTDSVRIVP